MGQVMIPAMIGDLQERVPPLDVPPSEGFVSEGTSRHRWTNSHIVFDQRRPCTTSHFRPEEENGCYFQV
jgi:hypothetical protein